jgi:hypothetical protein
MGAVVGALNIPRIRARFSSEASVRVCALVMGAALAVVAESRIPILTGSAPVVAGAAWMVAIALFNIAIQLSGTAVGGRSSACRLPSRHIRRCCDRQLDLGAGSAGSRSGYVDLAFWRRDGRSSGVIHVQPSEHFFKTQTLLPPTKE